MVRSAPAPTLAVFTKNRSNPAYHGARLGADRVAARFGARTIHYVPEKPDDVDQQAMLVERAILERPDAVVFVPVHETALNPSMLRLNDAGMPVVSMIAPATAAETSQWFHRTIARWQRRSPVIWRSGSAGQARW